LLLDPARMSEGERILIETLRGTLSAFRGERDAASANLKRLEGMPSCAPALLKLSCVTDGSVDVSVRQAAAIALKNFIAEQWTSGGICDADKASICSSIVQAVIRSDAGVRKLLAEALRYVAKCVGVSAWPQLLPEIVRAVSSQDVNELCGGLTALSYVIHNYEKSKHHTEAPRLYPHRISLSCSLRVIAFV